jgi:hypothetical protein
MANVKMTLAVAHYDRHVLLLDGTVAVEGADGNGEAEAPH